MASRGTNRWRLEEWGTPCKGFHTAVVTGNGGKNGRIRKELEMHFTLLLEVFDRMGYEVNYNGGYACRTITGGRVFSPHAWAIAMDINPGKNPYNGLRLITDIPYAIIEAVYLIRTAETGRRVFKWGGDWDADGDFSDHNVWDAMHFEAIITPGEAAEGVIFDGDLYGLDGQPTTTIGAQDMFCSKGDEGPRVEYWQRRLVRLGADITFPGGPEFGIDGDFGGAVQAAVVALVPGSDGFQIGPYEAEMLDALHTLQVVQSIPVVDMSAYIQLGDVIKVGPSD